MIGRACKTPGCLCHPALCEGARCPDFRRQVDIRLMHQSIYGTGNKAHSCSRDGRGIRGDRGPQRSGTELAGLCASASAWYRSKEKEKVSKNLLTSHGGKQGIGFDAL